MTKNSTYMMKKIKFPMARDFISLARFKQIYITVDIFIKCIIFVKKDVKFLFSNLQRSCKKHVKNTLYFLCNVKYDIA